MTREYKEITIYIAEDGKKFEKEQECKHHEKMQRIRKENGVVYTVSSYNAVGRVEVFSTMELAELSVGKNSHSYYIQEIIIDLRFC